MLLHARCRDVAPKDLPSARFATLEPQKLFMRMSPGNGCFKKAPHRTRGKVRRWSVGHQRRTRPPGADGPSRPVTYYRSFLWGGPGRRDRWNSQTNNSPPCLSRHTRLYLRVFHSNRFFTHLINRWTGGLVKRMAEEVEELATAIVDTSARITSGGRRHMSFKIMSNEFDSLATLIRCRVLAAKIANELRNKRPAHFVDKLSLADIHASLERDVGVLEQKTSTVGRQRTAPVVKELQQARNR